MKYYAGIDIGGTFVKLGIVDEAGNLLIKDQISTGKEFAYTQIASAIAEGIERLCQQTGVRIEGAGIGAPGIIDSEKGVIVYNNNLGWRNVPLCKEIGQRLGVPAKVTNDANAAALGEAFCGAGKNYGSLVFLTLGTGVGGGIIIDGKIYEGGRSAGAEIGHEVIRFGGEKCTCGRKGCFEAYASATALIRQTKRAMQKHPDSALWQICGGDIQAVNGKTAFDGMRAEDKAAKKVVKDYIAYLAAGIVNVANIFRPDAVLLGGGVCKEGETLLKPLRRLLARDLYGGTKYAPVALERASLGNDAGIFGAARLVME